MDRSEIRDAMDSCRPGSGDLELPELAPLAEALVADPLLGAIFNRIERADRRIAAATLDVTVPDGLVERILARLPVPLTSLEGARAKEQPSIASIPAIAAAVVSASISPANGAIENGALPPQPLPIRRRSYRRMSSLGAIVASALIIAAVAIFWRPHTPLSSADLIANSGDWSAQVWQQATWHSQPLTVNGYPVSSALRAQALAWTDVSSIVGENAVAYDVSVGGHRAALFVIPTSDPVADPVPPMSPQSSTEGKMIGCWQANGVVYVLVVEGDARAYQNLIRHSAPPSFA